MKLATLFSCSFAALVPTASGDITHSFNTNPASSPEAQQVANSVAAAAAFYNLHGSFNKHWNVTYHPGIPTAEGNYDGYMGYGGIRNERVAFHEAAHTFGMGTHWTYGGLIAGGTWRGQYGNRAAAEGYGAGVLNGDGHAIWPGGFNYDNEDGYLQRHYHTRVMAGIRSDMGILSYTREARNEAVVAGETAEFKVESPLAVTWQWKRNGVNLNNGGDISGANTATLRIANAEAADAGTYTCAVTGAGETLNNRPRQLWVHAIPQVAQYNLNGNALDTVNTNHGSANGAPVYVAGKVGQAVDLDGSNDFIDLPDPVGRAREITVATWVNWDGGSDWQRIFDFGTGVDQYLFLCPKAGGGGMRLALKDAVNRTNVEHVLNVPTLAVGQWVHLAAVLRENYMTLYVDGKPVGSTFQAFQGPADFPATNNYIGKSQFNDPLFNGRVDEFRVYAKALNGEEIWSIWGQSANQPPVFSSSPVVLPAANGLQPYTGTLVAYANDPDGNPLTFTKLTGPGWLTIASNGTLSGNPGPGDNGVNSFIVRVTDPSGASSDATVQILAFSPPTAPVTASLTAPLTDADDVSFLPGSIGEPDTIAGTISAADNDESTCTAENRTSKGQSFTTGSHPQGYFLQSFTFQHVNWPALTPTGTSYDIQPGDQWEFQIGTINGLTKTPLLKYNAVYDGAALTGSGDSGTGRYLTFNVSGTGVQLAPATTYYFEIAPLSGDPTFELNSVRNGAYTGGTAYRGGNAGTIGTGVFVLGGDYAFHANLEAKTTVPASTVAWWNFEEGAADANVAYNRTAAGLYEGSIFDQSGNANHLSVWGAGWHKYRANVPATTTPQSGAANTRSIQNTNAFPAISATGTSLSNWSPAAWTIEAALRPDDATLAGHQTFIGRDSQGAASGDPALAAFYFAITPSGALRLVFTDAAGNNWALNSAANALQDAKWQAVAATSDGDTVSMYLKNISNGDPAYTLLGTLDISASANPALSTGSGDGGDWDRGVFTVARGLFNGTHTDRYFGHIDDIRFTDGVLAPSAFLYTAPPPPPPSGYAAWINNHPEVGSSNEFNDDPDRDGLANGIESFFGTSPGTSNGGLREIAATGATLTFQHSRNDTPPADVSVAYRWSLDLVTWHTSGENHNGTTVTLAASPDTPAVGTTTVTASITGTPPSGIFVDLQVSQSPAAP